MNIWTIIGIALAVVALTGVFVVNVVSADIEKEPSISSCSDCGNSCSLEDNCGLASCGAVSGGSGCGCGR